MKTLDPTTLLQRAKSQLGSGVPETRFPPHYLGELKKLLELYPDGHNFLVTLHGGKGFGQVTCQIHGCGKNINLTRRFGGDGGKKIGFGTFNAYRNHLASHETSLPLSPVKFEDELIKYEFGMDASEEGPNQHNAGSSKYPLVKEELQDTAPAPSRKRSSQDPFEIQVAKKAKTNLSNHYMKHIKEDQDIKSDGASPTIAQNPFERLENIRLSIAGQHSRLDRLRGLKSSPDIVQSCEGELRRLLDLERDYSADIDMQPSSSRQPLISDRNPVVKREVAPFPLDLDIKPRRFSLGLVDTKIKASSSAPRKFSMPDYIAHQALSSNASRSSTPDVSIPGDYDIGREFDDEEDESYEYNLPQVTEYMNRIGIKTPAPVFDANDENGDYHGRGRDIYEGPSANPDDLAKFLVAANAETFDGNATVDEALKCLSLKSLSDLLPGMEVTLLAHQAIGVSWMLNKESGHLKGGCMADEMGLGKTIQMIATMLKNQPSGKESKTTLIVAPLALLDQWKAEIEEKTNVGLECLIYHGNGKTANKKKLLSFDVVLTTFNTLAREWPDYEADIAKKKKAKKKGQDFIVSDDDDDMLHATYRNKKRKEKAGLLFQVEFFRVVLDEAQNIRNRRTRVSRAVTDLQAKHRWCLTGTPIVNTLVDAYAYLRFLKIRPWYDWTEFNNHITLKEKKNPSLAITRLHAITNMYLLRRKKDSMLNGMPLVQLPEKEIKLVKLEFSTEEREIYNMVEARNQATFNRYLRAGTVLKNYHQVLVLLLRLRQICSHPSLIAEDASALVSPEEAKQGVKLVFSSELTRASRLVSEEFVVKMKEKIKDQTLARVRPEGNSPNGNIDDECPICYDLMVDAVITHCGHVFCRECIVDFINRKAPTEAGAEIEGCPFCRDALDVKKLFTRSAFEPSNRDLNGASIEESDDYMSVDEDDGSEDEEYDPKGKGKARARPRHRKKYLDESDDDDDISDFIVESDEEEEEKDARRALKQRLGKKRTNVIVDSDDEIDTPEEKEVLFGVRKPDLPAEALKLMPRFLPSSKMKYMMAQLQKLFKSKPDEKVMIVSQWTSCLQLVSNYLTEKNIPHVKYQGDMTRPKRDQAVKVFMAKEKAKVMLMSLKCGGVGLNLTRANNVISLDLGWSQAIESQAFDRVHRLGQQRKVIVQRVVIADTVEDRILALQQRKQSLADGTLGEGTGKKMGRLSVTELANLFGLDARGNRTRHN